MAIGRRENLPHAVLLKADSSCFDRTDVAAATKTGLSLASAGLGNPAGLPLMWEGEGELVENKRGCGDLCVCGSSGLNYVFVFFKKGAIVI